MMSNKIDQKTSLEIFNNLHEAYLTKLDYLSTQDNLLFRQNKLIYTKENNIEQNNNTIKNKKDLLHTIRRKLEYAQKDDEVFVNFTKIFKIALLLLSITIIAILANKLRN
tara:strand:+ start:45 stop:374 length:330 start_codon:yes stop_codon:yes gene_type:complete